MSVSVKSKALELFWDGISRLWARVRWKCYKLSMRIALGDLCGWGMDRNMVSSVVSSVDDPVVAEHVTESLLLSEAKVERFNYPVRFPQKFVRTKAIGNRYVHICREVAISPDTGAVWVPKRRIFRESLGTIYHFYAWGGLIDVMRRPRRLPDGRIYVTCAKTGYFHWLLDAMAQVLLAEKYAAGNLRVVVSADTFRFVLSGLAFFGYDGERIVKSARPVLAPHSVLVSRNDDIGLVRDENIAVLREAILRRVRVPVHRERRIYISRALERNRAISNESEVEKLVASFGFDVCYFEKMSVAEQMQTMAEAAVVMGVHGAGLSNMIAGQSGLKVIELLNPAWYNTCFAQLALKLGFEYDYLMLNRGARGAIEAPIAEIAAKLEKEFDG